MLNRNKLKFEIQMKIIGINGSPRKDWNTGTLVKKALEGAASAGAETELIELYAEPVKGCYECFACKRKGNRTGGICAIRDNLRPILEKAYNADAIVIGSPNYFGYPSGMVRCFIERYLFPLMNYDAGHTRVLGERIIPSAIIFTMNATDRFYNMMHYDLTLGSTRDSMEHVLGYAEQYNAFDTLQFADYSKMDADMFDPAEKQSQHEMQFPIDEQNCFELGKRLILKIPV